MTDRRFSNTTTKVMPGPEFRAWRQSRGYSLPFLARELGTSVAAIQKFELNGISQVQALAIAAVEAKLSPISPPRPEETS